MHGSDLISFPEGLISYLSQRNFFCCSVTRKRWAQSNSSLYPKLLSSLRASKLHVTYAWHSFEFLFQKPYACGVAGSCWLVAFQGLLQGMSIERGASCVTIKENQQLPATPILNSFELQDLFASVKMRWQALGIASTVLDLHEKEGLSPALGQNGS